MIKNVNKNMVFPILLMIAGFIIFFITYKDGEKRKAELTTSYIMHLKGYVGGIVLFLIGLILFFKN
jgi:hypothetical protein